MTTNKLLYKSKKTGKTKRFTYGQAKRLNKDNWEFVPETKHYTDENGADHYKIFMEDCIVDVIEQVPEGVAA